MKKVTKNFISLLKNPNWFNMKYDGRKKEFRGIDKKDWFDAKQKAFRRRYIRTTANDYILSNLRKAYLSIKEWSKPEHRNYQKVAMYGNTWLYLCSPIFGHKDYNKSRLLEIKGHEKQCEWLINVSKRVAKGD